MPEPYHYSLYDAPSGSPRMGTGRADDTPARIGRFLRQLALLLVLGWALSLVGLPLLSELDYQAHKAGLGVLGRFLAELLPPLAVFLLALLLFGRAAARPVPVRILGVCLLFGVCAQLLIVQTMEFLPWQLCAPQFFCAGAAGWVCGALAAGPGPDKPLGRRQARRLALALFGTFFAARLVSGLMQRLLYQLMMAAYRVAGRPILVQWLVGLANMLVQILALAACLVLVRRTLGLARRALWPGAKSILLFLLCSLALAAFCWLKTVWRVHAPMGMVPGGIMGYLDLMSAQLTFSSDVLRLSLLVQSAALLWYGAVRTPLPPPDLPRGAGGARLNALYERAEAGDPDAQFELAACYAQGTGTRRDLEKAARLYRAAAENGSEAARLALLELRHGPGLPAAPQAADEPPQYTPKYIPKA